MIGRQIITALLVAMPLAAQTPMQRQVKVARDSILCTGSASARQKRACRRLDSLIVAPQPTPQPEPTPTPDTSAVATILRLLGPTKTVQQTAAAGFAAYDSVFVAKLPALPEKWEDDYYDRGVVYFARYARTGDPQWLARATAITLAYRAKLDSIGFNIAAHWTLVRGLELHYRLTGDTLSRRAVAGMFAEQLYAFTVVRADGKMDIGNTAADNMENRIQAKVLHGALSAYRMGASYRRVDTWGGDFGPANWPTRLRAILNAILGTQRPDGSYPWSYLCGGQLNYMVGMLNDVLIEYYRDFEADPRIPSAIERANDYLWSTQWLPADQSFNYLSVACATGGPGPAGDLNGLFLASFGWLYHQTGDVRWRDRGDAILAGLVSPRWSSNYTGSKQFNQAFVESYRYFGWR